MKIPAPDYLRAPAWLQERGYEVIDAGINLLAVHKTDPTLKELQAKIAQTQSSAARSASVSHSIAAPASSRTGP